MDVHFNSIARSHGEKNGVCAGRPWRAAFIASMGGALLAGTAIAQTASPKPAPVYIPTSLKAETGVPRTPQGTPDFQGEVWESEFFAGLTGIPFVSPGELVITEAQSKASLDGMLKMFSSFPGIALDPEIQGLFATLKGSPIVRGQRRSRLLVMPADGKLPMTPEAQAEIQKVTASFTTNMNIANNPEERGASERCTMLAGAAPFTSPTMFNPMQFVQTRDHIVIHTEGSDEARIVPFTAKHQPANTEAPYGDPIARWEGDTLVIETINSPAGQRLRVSPFGGVIVNPGAKIIEKITRVSRDEIVYQFTIEDPKVFTAPWLGEFSLFRSAHNRMYGSHCHEGNYALANILAGARYEERNPPPSWDSTISETTTDPALRWTQASKNANDARSWAVIAPRDGGGLAKVAMRIERNGPTPIPGAPDSLSEIDVFTVDCAGQRIKMLAKATYTRRNLSGEKANLPPLGDWAPTTSQSAITPGIAKACP